MTHKEIARRLRDIADREPTYVALPEIGQDDMEALVRATQPARRRGLLSILRGRP